MLELLAIAVDSLHALAMVVWGIGLPLLFWHRFPRLSRVYVFYSIGFVVLSVSSHLLLGECALTTVARELWNAGTNGELRDRASFVVRLVEFVAGIRPDERWVVSVWEGAILLTSLGTLWQLRARKLSPDSRAVKGAAASARRRAALHFGSSRGGCRRGGLAACAQDSSASLARSSRSL